MESGEKDRSKRLQRNFGPDSGQMSLHEIQARLLWQKALDVGQAQHHSEVTLMERGLQEGPPTCSCNAAQHAEELGSIQ